MKEIKILGSSCSKCGMLFEVAEEAAKEMGIEYNIEKITDVKVIMGYGVMALPALVVDGQVKSVGKVLKKNEVIEFLK